MKVWMIAPVGLALVLAACGQTQEQRAASGGLGGAAAGALVGGPVGAVVGGAAGAAGGLYREEAQEALTEQRQPQEQTQAQAQAQAQDRTMAQQQDASGAQLTNQEVRQAQQSLQQMGLYDGQIDGLYGPRTIRAVEEFQRTQGLPQTASLDQRTQSALMQEAARPDAEQDQPDGGTAQ